MTSILEMKSPLNSKEIHIYEAIKDLKAELQKLYKEHKHSNVGQTLLEQAKVLTQLVEQREVAESVLSNLDTPFFSMDKQIEKLNAPLQHYAERVAFWIKKGDLFKTEQYMDLQNFVQFAQRKSKIMKIYRRLAIIRTRSMIHDLASQQSAVVKMMGEWQHELSNLEKTLGPLMAFNTKYTTAGPHDDMRVRRTIVEDCVKDLHYFPKIQALCETIAETEDLQFDKVFGDSAPQIRTEIGLFEASVQSVVTQMTLIRAVMAAVNDKDPVEAEKQLKVLDDEVMKQSIIFMNDRITDLQVILNEFRRHQVTQNLALQNLDNVLNEVMIDDFYSTDHALMLEDGDFIEEFQEKRASELLAEQKLESLAGNLEKEFNSDTSQETEDLMESVIQYR